MGGKGGTEASLKTVEVSHRRRGRDAWSLFGLTGTPSETRNTKGNREGGTKTIGSGLCRGSMLEQRFKCTSGDSESPET